MNRLIDNKKYGIIQLFLANLSGKNRSRNLMKYYDSVKFIDIHVL